MAKQEKQSVGDTEALPTHVAIVMDGNGRWAKKRLLPRAAGHKAGVGALKQIIEASVATGVKVVTVFAFSSENWNRPESEVSTLMNLFVSSIKKYLPELSEAGVSLRFIGSRHGFSEKLLDSLAQAESDTSSNSRLILNVAMNYGGRWDIADAAMQLAKDVVAGKLEADAINEAVFAGYVSLADLPAVDLFIRTGGEHRISNFLLWQCAYSELYFTDTFWPDFDQQAYQQALQWYAGRQRRFGRTGEQVETEQQSLKQDKAQTC